MIPQALVLRLGGSELVAVPAIHFHHEFGCAIHRNCFHASAPPDAIAVELGPEMASAAGNLLRDLRDGFNQRLPVMLGLIRQNRLIRASLREKTFQLQQHMWKDLSELPLEMLHRELGFSSWGLLCISPTDSIIEAIRSALELNVPLYGVDLEETPGGIHRPVLIQDPQAVEVDLPTYLALNAPYAAQQRDEEIDLRREVAMASRLKELLGRYRRVLFTCGMAHWLEIRRLLQDPSLPSSSCTEMRMISPPGDVRRVVVHPVIAVRYMDRFPAMVQRYQEWRAKSVKQENGAARLDPSRVFHARLKKAYQDHFVRGVTESPHKHHSQDLETRIQFETYIRNLCVLHNCVAPNLSLLMTAADETMSRDFVKTLTQIFMNYPWASPSARLDYPILSPGANRGEDAGGAVLLKDSMGETKPFYLKSMPGNGHSGLPVHIPYQWNLKSKRSHGKMCNWGALHTWSPWDYLNTSMSIRANERVAEATRKMRTEIFEGSMLEGIDLKSTLRSYSKGAERFHVRDSFKAQPERLNGAEGFPIVWVLHPDEPDDLQWLILREELEWIEKYVIDKQQFRRVRGEHGNSIVSSIVYVSRGWKKEQPEENLIVESSIVHGQILFQPPFYNHKQFAHWAELTQYKRNPCCNGCSLGKGYTSDLQNLYRENHGIEIEEQHWTSTLILLALPFAVKRIVTVVAPQGYEIEKSVFEKAHAHGVALKVVSLDLFNKKEIQRISVCHMVSVISHDPVCVYPREVERIIGEAQNEYRDLIPQHWLNFGEEPADALLQVKL